MELLDEVVRVMSPHEMRVVRRLAGWTLRRLSVEAKISVTQLSQFENARNGLNRSQIETVEKILFEAARQRNQALSVLLSREEREDEMATAS
ncbi:MAG: helix-turn-helix transcriptional regulator [Candidatus Sulfotelmatobacter sp.]